MKQMKIEGITDVFFDLDHTLWDFDKNSELAFKKILKLNDIDVDINNFLHHYVSINLKYWKLYREEKIEKKALRFGRLNDAFSAIGYQVKEAVIYKLADDYIRYLTTFNHLFENTFEILDYLNLNYNLHIITNGFDEIQYKKLTLSNIDKYFKTVTNSEMVGVKKPNPKIFNFALESAKSISSQSVMIGDNYEADILGAKNIGMEVVFFDIHNEAINDNIKRINNLIQLKKFL
ncbi:YjjG family noncanonical pyrimidine nucleotidase [Flavivirga abyssicola]|uniref:YjjG family noncanonical pyrimidine nucleotidase n=1 Tax=Flavivirga abyssicola TaxID=3063533 RepID=UPI002ED5C9B2|nr:YjjG family noncanonical pyrimidine nucleotidase [Flavivirga sp. MEBiC07777]